MPSNPPEVVDALIEQLRPKNPPLMPGTKVPIYGTIGAVGTLRSGERYYWLIDPDTKAVSMMPAVDIEPLMLGKADADAQD